jgi:hypothetical protein
MAAYHLIYSLQEWQQKWILENAARATYTTCFSINRLCSRSLMAMYLFIKPREDDREIETSRGERNNTFNTAILLTSLLSTLHSVVQTGTRLDCMHTKGCIERKGKKKETQHFIHRMALTVNSSKRLVFVLKVQ